MTREDKQLLLRDLCARLPYGVIIYTAQGDFKMIGVTVDRVFTDCDKEGKHNDFPIEVCKPYLRPMSSMTPDERFEYDELNHFYTKGLTFNVDEIDWLLARHFDYRGLIPKGLALEAPEGMYKTE